MSNPAVFKLAETVIGDQKIVIEDNIGESIHLHIGLVRIDMTVKEFKSISCALKDVLNELTDEFFDIGTYDPYFLERISPYLNNIKTIECKKMLLSDLKVIYQTDVDKFITTDVENSPVSKYYNKENINIDIYDDKKDIFSTNQNRARKILETVQIHSPKEYVIYTDNYNRIIDGYYTAAALFKIYGGSITVKTKSFCFEPYDELIAARRIKFKSW